MKTQH